MYKLILLLFVIFLTIGCTPEVYIATHSQTALDGTEVISEYVITDVNIVPLTEDVIIENQNVYIKGRLINKIVNASDDTVPAGLRVIEGNKGYLIPGLVDSHVHAYTDASLEEFLDYGVTFVRNMMGSTEFLSRRDRVNNFKILGPEMITGTELIDGDDPPYPATSKIILDVAEVEPYVMDAIARGYDFLKVYHSLSVEVYDEIMRVAHRENIDVAGHVSYNVGMEHALTKGQLSNEHLTQYGLVEHEVDELEYLIDLTVESGMWNCPTLAIIEENEALANEMFGMHFERSREFVKRLHDKGGKIVAGSDYPIFWIPAGKSLHDSLRIMVESGLTPYEALKTATYNPADMLGLLDRLGTIEVGKEADLVLLNDNPLIDIKHLSQINEVFSKGRVLSDLK